MKNIKNIFYVGMLALCTMSFTACSDEETYDFPGDPYNHVYLQNKGGTFTFVHTPISSISTLDLTLPLYCNHRVTSNFIAKVEVDNSLVAAYNEENNTEYAEIPVSSLVMENTEIRFEQGGLMSVNELHITTNEAINELRDVNGYLIPIRITAVEGENCKIVDKMSTTYVIVNVKEDTDNIYDDAADELVTGTLVSDRSGWTAIVPDGADAQAMFTESDDYWSGRASAAGEELPVIINFGKSYTFDGISASYSYYGYYTYASWTKSSKIEISGDGTTWEEIGILSNKNIIQVFYAPVTAQYLRITVPAPSSSWSRASFSCGNFNIYAK